tara:strand:- start:551 stop:1015 length:465 start_codon:yes stop_codon:yes gene_type:complete
MSDKKKFNETTVGKLLLGAAGLVNPTLGKVLSGVTSPKQAIAEIGKAKISEADKIKLQQMIYEQQNKEMEEISNRWKVDNGPNSGWLSKNVRPLVLVWCIIIFSFAGILDSIETIPFHINENWNSTFENVMLSVVLAYFGGRSSEKAINIFKGK